MRADGRTAAQLRPLACEQAPLSRADGSARFCHGKTVVLCSVNGPTEVKLRNELVDRAYVDVIVQPPVGASSTKEKVLEEALHGVAQACVLTTSYPRTMIQIVVQIVHDDGSVLAAAVNAMTLALLDAGLAMRTTITAASVAYMPGSPDAWLDPTAAETEAAESVHTAAVATTSPDDVVMAESLGAFSAQQLLDARQAAAHASAAVVEFLRTALERSHKRGTAKRA